MRRFLRKLRWLDAAVVALAALTALAFWTRNLLLIAVLIPSGIWIYKRRGKTRAERERLEALSLRSLAVSMLLPILLTIAAVVYFFWKIIPMIIENWQ
jgi:hypothetical protein